ncbi:FAD:protein FMN transferase [Pseudoalteromonas tunicata]|jgi:thiamine biosynthesis lipoprotein|uniref:FAD:protein FMN transferase n=1 Tax=Pseudoalteromonas tunicata D2 TaxID=87626 RepID=A4C6R5_9GAMM|nr:FAD:protein FMN transferase [Pseudoalteromonas tunicata]ATC95641.1 thiamine biosynthesis lipoprotein [Pseudoalteromonas tunicata]AXT31208.1 FAD:protein FMN transferase [Pseudoalteromonas tunicata]EAR29669.1 putative lipoprotein [Pseudoalteromonas tunicata D2]
MRSLGWKHSWFVLVSVLFFGLLLQGCEPDKKDSRFQEVLLQGKTMGTTFTIKAFVPVSQIQSLNLYSDITQILADVNQSMSTYIPDSEISRFNRSTDLTPFPISDDFRIVVAESIRLGKSTQTLDVTMGPLINLWGFGPDKHPDRVPSDDEIRAIKQRIGVDKLVLNEQGIAKTIPDLELSFSAIAKGYGIDKVALFLEKQGLTNYMVEIGGELRISGTKENNEPWTIAIEEPDVNLLQRAIHKTLHPGTMSVATSGDYRIYFEVDGVPYAHIISPTTGKPIIKDLVSVTVLNPSAMTADGLATALVAMGTEKAKAYVEQNNIPAYLISKTDKGLESFASKAFAPYM